MVKFLQSRGSCGRFLTSMVSYNLDGGALFVDSWLHVERHSCACLAENGIHDSNSGHSLGCCGRNNTMIQQVLFGQPPSKELDIIAIEYT